jgi:glucose/mannose-6-phosphate isomerase
MRQKIIVVLLNTPLINPRISIRYQITAEILSKAGIKHKVIEARGKSPLAQMMELVLFGDYVSFYLALLNRADPTPVPTIDYLKSRLAETQ